MLTDRGAAFTDYRLNYWNANPKPGGYNQDGTQVGPDGMPYRYDCSGYFCSVWGISGEGLNVPNTAGLRDVYLTRIGKEDLRPGDAILVAADEDSHPFGHVAIFGGWLDTTHSTYQCHDFGYGDAPHHRPMPYPYDEDRPYKPYRLTAVHDTPIPVPPPPSTPQAPPPVVAKPTPKPQPDEWEQIMAFYASKEDFEKAMATVVAAQVQAQVAPVLDDLYSPAKGVTDPKTGQPTGKIGLVLASILGQMQSNYNQGNSLKGLVTNYSNQIKGAIVNAARAGGTPEQIADAVAKELAS